MTVCCTTDDDVHAVAAVGNEPAVGIHFYGGNIGTIRRRSYDAATGEARWFVPVGTAPREPVTPETQAKTAAGDCFVTYDELRGPDLDGERWSQARLPLPMGEHIPIDRSRNSPSARARGE